jgi:hypothetical protein
MIGKPLVVNVEQPAAEDDAGQRRRYRRQDRQAGDGAAESTGAARR